MSDGSLLVQGLVDKAERKNAIRAALKNVDANLRIEIYLPRELRSGSELYNPPEASVGGIVDLPSSEATLADLSSGRVPLYGQMHDHFAKPDQDPETTERQINAFSNEVVTLARQTFLHAWALKRLDVEFGPERTAGLSPVVLQEINKIRGDHRRWIATISHQQAQMLSELPGMEASAASVEAGLGGNSDSDVVLQLAREQNDLVRSLFTTSAASQPAITPELARLLAVLRRMGS
jgi:hypothetical protein